MHTHPIGPSPHKYELRWTHLLCTKQQAKESGEVGVRHSAVAVSAMPCCSATTAVQRQGHSAVGAGRRRQQHSSDGKRATG